jgi:uncharacterized protein (DUF1015 family)
MSPISLFAPFRGERYADPSSLARRLAPPYDVISPEQRARLAAQDPANIVRVDLPTADGGGDPYAAAARLLADWRAHGVLARDGEASAYVLRTTSRFEDGSLRARTGVFLAVAAEPFAGGRVKPHEKTHQGPKEDRRRLTHATAYNLSPVFLLAPDTAGELERMLRQATEGAPWTAAEAIGASHEVWVVSGERAMEIARAAGAEAAYIADGHHRYETSVVIRDEAPPAWRAGAQRTLAHVVSFRDPGLEILPTHRVVAGAPVSRGKLLEVAVGPFFEAASSPNSAVLTVVFGDGSEAALACNREADLDHVPLLPGPWAWGLPSWMCDELLVGRCAAPLLGASPALGYTASAVEARAAAREAGAAFAVLLRPTELREVKLISDLGQVMPPKSTYFAPKVPTGVVLRPLEGEG